MNMSLYPVVRRCFIQNISRYYDPRDIWRMRNRNKFLGMSTIDRLYYVILLRSLYADFSEATKEDEIVCDMVIMHFPVLLITRLKKPM
jgi:hypothetical protein